jgi:hypothetical protein
MIFDQNKLLIWTFAAEAELQHSTTLILIEEAEFIGILLLNIEK